MEKLPYENLILFQNVKDSSPSSHYPELIMYLIEKSPKKSIYIQSSSIYVALLIGSIVYKDVKIIVSYDFPEKDMLLKSYVLNDMK